MFTSISVPHSATFGLFPATIAQGLITEWMSSQIKLNTECYMGWMSVLNEIYNYKDHQNLLAIIVYFRYHYGGWFVGVLGS